MKEIKDERLKQKNLSHIRIVFMVQTIGIVAILAYDLITKGLGGMTRNPLWVVFIITAIVNAYLSMTISVDHENPLPSPSKKLSLSLTIISILSIVGGFFVARTEGYTVWDGLLIGTIIFICFLLPVVYIYRLRRKRLEEEEASS